MNQGNASSLAATTQHFNTELVRRFRFQPYGEDEQIIEDTPSAGRRALHDKRLLEEVYEQLAMQSHLETGRLSLAARNGIVTIDGIVSTRTMRAQIGHFIRRCPFVRNVVNRLQLDEELESQLSRHLDIDVRRDSDSDEEQQRENRLRALAA